MAVIEEEKIDNEEKKADMVFEKTEVEEKKAEEEKANGNLVAV